MKRKPMQIIIDPGSTTVAQVQGQMRDSIKNDRPVYCPCCKQLVALTDRPLNAMMAKVTIILHRHFLSAPGWLHVGKHLVEVNKLGAAIRGSEWTRLTHWGVLEERPKHPGEYKMTERGHKFATVEIKLPKVLRTYNGKPVSFGTEQADIKECLGEDLDYAQLIAGNYGAFLA